MLKNVFAPHGFRPVLRLGLSAVLVCFSGLTTPLVAQNVQPVTKPDAPRHQQAATRSTSLSSGDPVQQVVLWSDDGLVSLKGIIQSYDDQLITIKASIGIIGIERKGITCLGKNCPQDLRGAS